VKIRRHFCFIKNVENKTTSAKTTITTIFWNKFEINSYLAVTFLVIVCVPVKCTKSFTVPSGSFAESVGCAKARVAPK
jgi:hypothetical protein